METIIEANTKEMNLSEELIQKYTEEASKESWFEDLEDIVVLGSHGRKDGKFDSDMDMWLIMKNTEDLEEVAFVGNQELLFRSYLSNSCGLPSLDRHLASIYDLEEAELYRKIYFRRVGLPFLLGEQTSIKRSDREDLLVSDKLSYMCWILAMEEFINRQNLLEVSESESNYKWVRRIVQEGVWEIEKYRIPTKGLLDDYYLMNFEGNWDLLYSYIQENIDQGLRLYDISESDLMKLRNYRTMITTLEKIRWEFVTSYRKLGRYSRWLKELDHIGNPRRYAFTFSEIREVVNKHNVLHPQDLVKSEGLLKILNTKPEERREQVLSPQVVYSAYRKWCLDSLSDKIL
jgi:predicted nucleotidyltransferase